MNKSAILVLLTFSIFLCNAQNENDSKQIPFIWFNDTLHGVSFEKTSMHIPVKFNNDSITYYFQFDTGSNRSYLYAGVKSDPEVLKKIKTKIQLSTSIGNIVLMPKKSNNTYNKDEKLFVGTIGADFLDKKIIEIDFLNQKITVLKKYNKLNYNLIPMKLSMGRPVISLEIMNKEYQFLYDTGSSLFDIWTDKRHWMKWKKDNIAISEFPISSWGKINTAYKTKIRNLNSIKNGLNLDLKYVWYNSNKNFKRIFKKANVSGLIGNRPFLQEIVLLDFKGKLLGLKKSN